MQKFLGELTRFELLPGSELTCYGPGCGISPAAAMDRIRAARNLFGPEEDRANPNPRWRISDPQLEPRSLSRSTTTNSRR